MKKTRLEKRHFLCENLEKGMLVLRQNPFPTFDARWHERNAQKQDSSEEKR